MKPLIQLAAWVEGCPRHNSELDECCPDFSCCRPHLLVPREEREMFLTAYISGDDAVVERLSLMFLCRAMSELDVEIISDPRKDDDENET